MVVPHRPQVSASVYDQYAFHPLRIESVTEQLRWISRLGGGSVLEIGVGAGFLRHCLRLFPEVQHTTVDIASDLHPDYLASVTDLPFADGQFDIVLCCEVLEHLPFQEFLPSLREIRRVTRHRAIVSLPDRRRRFGLAVCPARLGWLTLELSIPRWRQARRALPFTGDHYWEIGCRGTLGRDVRRKMREAGLAIEKEYRLYHYPWHTFFILKGC